MAESHQFHTIRSEYNITGSAPLTWNFPLLRQMQNVGNLSLITRQPNTLPSLCLKGLTPKTKIKF